MYAYRLLSYRARSQKELEHRLSLKGFPDDDIRKTIEHLKGYGYLDDLSLASNLRRHASDRKLLGKEGAKQFLRQRGIQRQDVETAISDYDELPSALSLINKKMKTLREYPYSVTVKKLSGALARKGYSSQTIRKALKLSEEEIRI
ncbi:MAG: regulatory protein RecX [Nitrospirae bacterium]|nr:regulatory protein RecX [Nitrospirota bacterium]